MPLDRVTGEAWSRKHGDPAATVVPRASRTVAPTACRVCGLARDPYEPPLCSRCRVLRKRIDIRWSSDKAAWEDALRRAWDAGAGVFRCHYTKVPLVEDKLRWPHPRYLVREHQTPGDELRIEVCCHVVNQMKGPLTDDAFRAAVGGLAAAIEADDQAALALDMAYRRLCGQMSSDLAARFVRGLRNCFHGGCFDDTCLSELEEGLGLGS